MKYLSLLLFLFVFVGSKAQIGTCGAGGAKIGGPYSDNSALASAIIQTTSFTTVGQETFSPALTAGTTKDLYYKVTGGTLGSISFRLFFSSIPTSSFPYTSVTANLYPLGNCTTPVVVGTTDLSHFSTNPNIVFYGVSNVDYVLKITLTVPTGSTLYSINVGYYYHKPPVTCTTCQTVCSSNEILSSSDKVLATASANLETSVNTYEGSLYNIPIPKGQSKTICVPITIPALTTTIGFRQLNSTGTSTCTPSVISYVLKDKTCNPVGFSANRPNANNYGSGFNPEFDNPPAGDYILCVTYDNTNGTCETVSPNVIGTYIATNSVIPACGNVDFDWKTGQSIPALDEFTTCQNTNYQLKADRKTTSVEYIAPGFDIIASGTTYDISTIQVQAGTTAYQTAFTKSSTTPLFSSFPVPYSSITYDHNIQVNATAAGAGDKIDIVDHASGVVIKSVPITLGTFVISIPAGTLKGTAIFSGPGVSNYQLDYPATLLTDYTANGYAIFNPSVAGNGTHTITYTWNNGTSACGTATKIVTVSGCPTPLVPCGSCVTPDCSIGNIPTYKDRFPASGSGCSPSATTNCPGSGAKKCASNLTASGTYVTYQTVTSDQFGMLGALIQTAVLIRPTAGAKTFTLTSNLYAMNDCNGVSIPTNNFNTLAPGGSSNNVYARGAANGAWNPEWNNLTPNTNYILKTTFVIVAGAEMTDYCMDYYGSTSCNANAGTTAVKINGLTPTSKNNPSLNFYVLCKDDMISFTPSGYTLPPTASGAGSTSIFGYIPYKCPPTVGTAPKVDNCWATGVFDINDPSTDKNDGSIITQIPGATNQTYYIVPVTLDHKGDGSTTMDYDLDNDGCFALGTTMKVTYLNEITIDTITECSNSQFKLKILGGSPEFVSGSSYSLSTDKGKFKSTSLTTATMTSSGGIDYLTGLVSGETFTITITDGVGCTKKVIGKYVCPCSKPTITLNATPTEVCLGATTTSFAYTATTNSPDKYSITWNSAAITAGFINVVDATLTASPQNITLPAGAIATTYTGSLTVKNSTTGCTSTAQNVSFVINGKPTITPTPNEVCLGATTTSFAYTATTNNPNKYSITWNSTAITDGFVDITDANLSTSPISVNIPSAATAQTYTGSLTVKNSTTGCTSTAQNISFVINGKPTITPTPNEVCLGATTTSFAYSGVTNSPNKYSITWNSAALADNFVNISDAALSTSPISINIPSAATAQTYIGSLIVKNSTTGCSSTAQNISFIINPLPKITGVFNCMILGYEVLTASTLPATLDPWATSASTVATFTSVSGHPEQIQVNGVLKGTSDISYTDIKGCKTKEQFTVGFVCDKITYIAGNQTICNGANPNPISVTSSDATEDVDFVYFPLAQTDTTTIYTGGTTIATVTPISGSGLAAFGTLDLDKIKLLPPNDYFVYAKFKTTPTEKDCRAFKEIKVTIKDTTSPLITIANTGTLNEYRVIWKDVPAAVSYKVDTVTYVKGNVPTTPNWKSLLPNITANHTLQAPLIFPNIPFGRTLLVQVTPLDVNGVKLSCNSIREKRIDNPSCTKPILEPLNIPDTVCEGASLDLLKGKINASSVKVNFEWYVSTDSLNWTLLSSGGDYLISNTTVNEATDLAIKTKLTMNKSFVRLFGKDVATGQCSDTTLPVKILVNEIPDATISIFPDPAKLCVGDPKSIEVTFQGSKGLQPYRFDFELDAVAKDTASSNIPGDGKVIKTFKTTSPILDSTFVLKKVTDKNGCFADISNQSVKMEVVALPQPIFQADKTIGCYPLEVIFTDKSAVLNTDVEWDFGNGDLDNTSLGVVKYVFQKSGDYTIKFKSTKNGCWDTMQKTNYIHVKDRPVAQFSPKKTNISLIDPEIQFINSSSSNTVYYKWIFGDGSPVSNLVNPKHKYIGEGNNGLPEPGKYLVELYAFINQDCWDSTSTIITIDDEQIFYIPNTFTPNNDERNNTFQPIFTSGFDAQNYHFLIYNRWGELMFESNNSQIGWDGTYGNKLLMNDTYTWKLQFKEKMTEKEHYLTGHVNLIK